MDLKSFVGNVIAGIVSSVLTYVFMYFTGKYRLKSRFSHLAGTYAQQTISNEPIVDAVTVVHYLKGNVIVTRGESPEGKWEGRITMNDALPEFGSGIYQYTDEGRNDCGVHQIQVSPARDMIYVLTTNTSHGRNSTFAYIWKKELPGSQDG